MAHFQRAMMMDIDQAAQAIREAEIEDFLEGFNQPHYRGMRINGVRVATWSSRDGWSGDTRPDAESGSNEPSGCPLSAFFICSSFGDRVSQKSTSGPMESTIEEVEKFAAKVDRAAERVFASASIRNRAPAKAGDPKIIAVFLLIRTLSNFRGTVILLRADRIVEARTIARCCFENLFHIAALRDDGQQFVREMAEDHEASRKARGEFLIQQTGEIPEAEWQQKLRAFLAGLGKGQTKRKSLDPKRVAARGPLLKGYVYYSQLSSDAAHPTLDALQRYLGRSQESGEPIRTIDIDPLVSPKERRQTLLMACEALLAICIGVMEILNLQQIINDELAALMAEYQALGFSDMLLSKRPEGDQSGKSE